MSSPTFFWHDYETFGVDPSKDRPAQFAGIRTDEQLNLIGDPTVLYCNPSIDILPSPDACLITGITPQIARSKGKIEAEFISLIHQELSKPGTCGAGFNSIRFDDEVTRYTLYRNFFDPYAREWQNDCSRWDIIDLARMSYALRPEGVNWPKSEVGHPSFKLEHLTVANGINHASAHDALSDVTATIELAKLLRAAQPKLFDWLFELRSKHKVAGLIDVRTGKPLIHTTRMYSSVNGCTSLVVPLSYETRNKSSVLVYDLRIDPEEFLELDHEELEKRLVTANDELPEGASRLPVKSLKINHCPAVAPLKSLNQTGAERINLDLHRCAINREKILSDPGFAVRVEQAFSARKFPLDGDVDTALYSGFFSDADKRLINQVRNATSNQLANATFSFSDSRLPELLFRYRARNWPESLTVEESERWTRHCAERYNAGENGMESYFERISLLRAELSENEEKIAILDSLEQWGDELLASM